MAYGGTFFILVALLVGYHGIQARRPPSLKRIKDPHGEGSYNYKTYYFDQQIDHFGFANEGTFKNRYLMAAQYWNRNGGPIFFYTGNEGDIEWFCENTGFMWDIAPEFNALLVFAEHRYYGKSLPFGSQSYEDKEKLNFLTSEQALADFAEIIRYLKATIPGAENSPVIAFGGSYGGMLAAWFRIKYPNVVEGALAASAPIWQFSGITPCKDFDDVTTATWARESKTCVANANLAYKTLDDIGSTASGLDFISKTFGLCKPLTSAEDISVFKYFLVETYTEFAEVDYPYPADFLAPLPGWPVKVACKTLLEPLSGKPLLKALSHVTNLYYNYTGDVNCINYTSDGSTSDLGYQGWDYQACTEMIMPMCSNGTGMICKYDWDFEAYSEGCFKSYGVKPRKNWITLEYWGKKLKTASNIIFSNGNLDPWSSGGVTETFNPSVVPILIPKGAHHLDLRASNPADTQYVIDARNRELNIIRGWLNITSVH